ncbi:phosphopantetheine-binding protein [Streptomyces sp. NPDC023327]|uniref:acyl carrier protein n=1 Tax=Streptomyces sp. NPDC023327 TaxID=3157088 RepID=UPI0033E15D99
MDTERLDLWNELRTLCASIMSVPAQDVVPQALLVADLGADSLDITELQAASEEHFGVSFKGTDPAAVSTVGDVADLIARLRTVAAPGVVTA